MNIVEMDFISKQFASLKSDILKYNFYKIKQ